MLYLFGSGSWGIILLVILFVVIFIKISNLKARLNILEKRGVSEAEPRLVATPVQVEPNVEASIPDQVYNQGDNKFLAWIKEDWLLKLGAFLLLIGLGWFTTYAFINNWIGELGRITLGIFVGVVVLALGSWRIKKYINQGGIFLVVGSAIILLTVFAAREVYNMFTPFFALFIMFLSTAYISLVSVKYNSLAVSLSGLVLAFVAPLLTNSANVNEISLFSYLAVVTLGAIWIVAIKKNWGNLIFASLVGVFLYSLSIYSDNLIWFIYGFAGLFFLASVINIINSKETDIKAFLWTAMGNGVFLLFGIMNLVSAEWQSLVIAVWIVIFAVGAFLSFNVTKIKSVFFVYAGVALAMLVVATTIELDGAALIVAYTVESFLVPVLIYLTVKDVRVSTIGALLMIGPAFLSLRHLDYYYSRREVFSQDFFVILLIVMALMCLGLLYRKIKEASVSYSFYPDNLLLIAGSVYGYVLLWSAIHVGVEEKAVAVTLSLVIFIIVGLIKYFYGLSVNSKTLRNYGGALIGFVILRLLFIDVWNMEMGAKVFVFILIGVLLMSTAFVSRKIKAGTLISLVLFLTLGFSFSAFAATETEIKNIIAAYRNYKDITSQEILVPTVMEVPFTETSLERFDFLVMDKNSNIFEPSLLLMDKGGDSLTATILSLDSSAAISGAGRILDNQEVTSVELPVANDRVSSAEIMIESDKNITTNSIYLLLDNYVALPNTISIMAGTDNNLKTVLATKRMDSQSVFFPEVTASKFVIKLTFSQPLRITELRLGGVNNRVKSYRLRFLAQVNHEYRIYFNPDRKVTAMTGEMGNLSDNNGVLKLGNQTTVKNPGYMIADTDGDNVPDVQDNCVSVSNTDQVDVNANGRGDVCDDFDKDGVINSLDNCRDLPNYNQLDSDADKVGDVCDGVESRLTEKYKWLPWVGIGFAVIAVVGLFIITALSMRKKSNLPTSN